MATRLWLSSWLILWVLALPLIHVHPEADHRHGQPSHSHTGLPHAVWSPDLPCEFAQASFNGRPSGAALGISHSFSVFAVGPATHAFTHPEIGFSLLVSSKDRMWVQIKFSAQTAVFAASTEAVNSEQRRTMPHADAIQVPPVLAADAPPRAPPV